MQTVASFSLFLVLHIIHYFKSNNLLFFYTGSYMYNKTDGEGWCFTAYCSLTCSVQKNARPCQTTTPPHTSTSTRVAPHSSPTPPLSNDCSYLTPPRKVFTIIFFFSKNVEGRQEGRFLFLSNVCLHIVSRLLIVLLCFTEW